MALTAAPVSSSCPAASPGVHYYAPGTGKTVAITFDDGPGPGTAQILAILKQKAVRATFFNLGEEMAEWPSDVRAELQQGHLLGNHTWDHPNLPLLSATAQASEIDRTSTEQRSLVGTPPCVFRPPYGNYDSTTLSLAEARNLTVWNWSVDPEDWKATSASAYWVNRIITRAEAGGSQQHPVVLFHNGSTASATIAALPAVIDYYRSHGYAFVDLLGNHGIAVFPPSGAPAPAAAATSAGLHVFWRDSSGHIRENTRRNGTWSTSTSLGGSTAYGPAAAQLSTTSAVVAITDADRHVEIRTVSDSGTAGWGNLAGSISGRPAVTADRHSGTITVAARTSAGTVYYRQRVAGSWRPWTSLGGGFVTSPAVAATPYGGITVTAAKSDGALWTRHFDGRVWGSWLRAGGLTDTADPGLILTPDGRHLLLLARDTTGAVDVRVGGLAGTGWGSWRSIGGVLGSGPAAAVTGAAVATVATGTDGYVYLDTASAGSSATGWSGWVRLPL